MKKHLTLVIAILGIVFTSQAQKVQIGFRLVGNFSIFIGSGADSLDLKGIWGGHGGIIVTVPVIR